MLPYSKLPKGKQHILYIRPFKVDCLFCIPARVAFVMTPTKTHRADCSRFPELGPFFGLKIRSVGAEKNAFKVFHSILQPASSFPMIGNFKVIFLHKLMKNLSTNVIYMWFFDI